MNGYLLIHLLTYLDHQTASFKREPPVQRARLQANDKQACKIGVRDTKRVPCVAHAIRRLYLYEHYASILFLRQAISEPEVEIFYLLTDFYLLLMIHCDVEAMLSVNFVLFN
jgi:hypothetical protein